MDLLQLLASGDVDAFNLHRGTRRLDFFAADLPGKSLAGVDLSGANLDKADLSGTDLSDASLYKTSMTGIDGTGLVLARALASRLRLKEAWLEEADFTDAELSRADFKEAVLTRSKAEGATLTGARLVEADARGALWPGVDLVEGQLTKANFAGADLRRADLTDASISEGDFTEARLDGAIASRLRARGTILVGASLMGARLDGANLAGADLTNADLTAADLTGANLTGAVLTGAKLQGAVLADAILAGVAMAGLVLDDVDLSGVDPNALGLSVEQLAQVAAVGAAYDPDAPLKFREVAVARAGDAVAVLWLNADGEEARSIRYCLVRPDADPVLGVLPTSAEGLLAKLVVPTGDDFELWLVQERPGGVSLLRYPLSATGAPGASQSVNMGYAPAVLPVARSDAKGAWLWGMSRRGPTLIIHRVEGEEFGPVHSEKVATGRGFLGKHLPVLVCKGGVVMPVGPTGMGSPLRAPDGFPSQISGAAGHDDKVLAVWLETGLHDDDLGGLRFSWLARRQNPRVEVLTDNDAVVSLDVLPTPAGVWVAWIEIGSHGGEVRCTRLPGAGVTIVPLDGIDPAGVRFAPGLLLDPEDAPALAIMGSDGGLVVTDVDGRPFGSVRADGGFSKA